MRFTYCPHCGTKLISKEIGDEGIIPFCDKCNIPLWDMFTTSIIAAVVNEYGEVALLRQNYVSTTKYVCVAGIMKIGESAEETVIREVKEEIGQDVENLEFISNICLKHKNCSQGLENTAFVPYLCYNESAGKIPKIKKKPCTCRRAHVQIRTIPPVRPG